MFRNIEGVINKSEEQEEWIVSAHYDTVCNTPGANDNASGVAVILEPARVLARSDTRHPTHDPVHRLQPGGGQPGQRG